MRKIPLCASLFALSLLASANAEAKPHRYVGVHPIVGGGACYIEAAHVHAYAPVQVKLNYRVHDGWYHFIGDPVVYGYDGDHHAYHGAHPVHFVGEADWCAISGPHHHAWAPVAGADFEVRGDVHWYVGVVPVAVERRQHAVVVAPTPVLVIPEPSLTVGIGVDVGVGVVGHRHHSHGKKAKRHKGKHKGWRH